MKTLLLILFLCTSCSTYIVKGKKYRVIDSKPTYGPSMAFSIGLGNQFKIKH